MNWLRTLSKTIFIWLLLLQVAVLPVECLAERKPMVERGTASSRRLPRQLPRLQELRDQFRDAQLDAIGHKFHVFGPEQLRELLLLSMTPKEREDLGPLLMRKVVKLTPSREGDALLLKGRDATFRIRWPKFPDAVFNINGVDWTYSSHQTLKFNVEFLMKLLAKHGKTALLPRMLLPEANAVALAITAEMMAAAFVGALLSKFVDKAFDAAANLIANTWCLAYYKESEKVRVNCMDTLEKIAKAKEVLEKMTAVKTDVAVKPTDKPEEGENGERTMWLPDDKVKSCPSGKSQDVYIADVFQAKMQKKTMQKIGDWRTVRFELQPGTGKMKKGVIAPVGTDMNSTEIADEAEAIFDFDENGLKTIYVRNPKRASIEDPPMMPMEMAKDKAALKPEEILERAKWVELVKQVSSLISLCILAEAKSKVEGPDGKAPPPPQQKDHPSLPTQTTKEKAPPDRAPQGNFN